MAGLARYIVRFAVVLILLQVLAPAFLSEQVGRRGNIKTYHPQSSKVLSPSFLKEIEEESEKSDKSERHAALLDFVLHFSNLDISFERLSFWRDHGIDDRLVAFFTLYRSLRI